MGRDLTDVVIEKKPDGSNSGAYDEVQVAPRVADDHIEKDCDVKECTLEKQGILGPKITNFDQGTNHRDDQKIENDHKKLSTPNSKPVTYGNVRGNVTVPHPFSLATEKRGCTIRHAGTESPPRRVSSPSTNNEYSPFKNSQPSSPFTTSRKLLQKFIDEEDNVSVTSSAAASVGTGKSVRSRVGVTVGTAPTFKSEERAEKRKEFYTKLEEKQRALEEKRLQYEARQREEQEAAIKQLRKSMVVKAKPVPDFYYEGPPPKVELKKLPVTRAVSPKLGRRKSCSDAVNTFSDEGGKGCSRAFRHSLGSLKEESNVSLKTKSPNSGKSNGNGSPKTRELRSKLDKELAKGTFPCKILEETEMNAEVDVQS
ncbi:hypothetical protein SAY86_029922 [Trapa natans]|uniref:TPX2 C-terminal domain-containing protein n=1 Tax=Trapa natans TaxID=22666 RepID=A0AAN7RGM5_TRANT|nr:hypothetical protein SAY86_029922 [Trapa natans]